MNKGVNLYMEFNKNQTICSSDRQREIWWWAIGLVPLDVSLTDEVKSKCTPDVLEGCRDWHAYFGELCSDMYDHSREYLPASPRQYRDFLENISAGGDISGDSLVWTHDDWQRYVDKINKSKAFTTAGISLQNIIKALERTGLFVEQQEQPIIISHQKHPKIFHAIKVMENSPRVRDTQTRGHFANCEFRQLFKCYTPGYNELLRKASDEVLFVTNELHSFAKEIKITRYIHFGIIKYKYKGVRILDYTLQGQDTPSLRLNMGTCVDYRNEDDIYFKALSQESDAVKNLFNKGLIRCTRCRADCKHERKPVMLTNQKGEYVCQNVRLRLNPGKEDLPQLYRLILARKQSIDQSVS